MKLNNLELKWLGHSGFLIKTAEGKLVYIDPYQIKSGEKADIILLTHPHYDHCSIQDINKIVKDGTIIVMSQGCQSKITKIEKKIEMKIMDVGQTIDVSGIKIGAVPAYNIDKPQHPEDERWLGYVLKIGNIVVYHAGDTDLIPEMEKLKNINVALLPVGGTFTMNAEEAAEAASIIKPSLAVPIHWGAGVAGDRSDAENFVNLCQEQGIKAEVLQKE